MQLRHAGIGAADVRVVVVTHEHIDHAGLAAHWASQGARIVAGRAALPALAGGYDAAVEAQRESRFAELSRHGMPAALLDRFRRRPLRPLRWEPCPADALAAAEDQPRFTLAGGETLRLLPAPGHTPGNLVALVEETSVLYSGDTILPTTIPTPGLHFPGAVEGDPLAPRWPSLPPFLRSVAALRALGLQRILPGHGDTIEQPEVYLDRFEDHHARRGARVQEQLDALGPATAFALTRAVFPRLPDDRLLQAMTEVLGHLDLLEERSLARRDLDGPTVRWSAA